jgi:hypothetical protein
MSIAAKRKSCVINEDNFHCRLQRSFPGLVSSYISACDCNICIAASMQSFEAHQDGVMTEVFAKTRNRR